MILESDCLLDVLRPTELHDFRDVFGTSGTTHDRRANTFLAITAVTALILGIQHLTDPTSVAPSPVTVMATR